MGKTRKGFTLIELIISVAILVILFIALYDLYLKNFALYKNDQQKVKAQIEVKNFSDTIYNYMKASYQDSIEVGTKGNLINKNEDVFKGPQESIFMVIPQNADSVEYLLDSPTRKNTGVNPITYSSEGILSEIMGTPDHEIKHFQGNKCNADDICSIGKKYYHYVMFTQKKDDETGENYIETISNITGASSDTYLKDNYNNIPGSRTQALRGIVEKFTIDPEYVEVTGVGEVLSKVSIDLEYSYGKGKRDSIKLDYTIRN
ncbi:MAG: type II secretion system protein [Clostridium sp.]